MTQKQTTEQRADEIYDELMDFLGAPELKIGSIDSVESQHRGESAVDRAARHEWYDRVFEEADRLLALRRLGQQNAAHEFLNEQRRKAMKTEKSERSKDIEKAEDQIDSLDQ